jgi:hypothetical protein
MAAADFVSLALQGRPVKTTLLAIMFLVALAQAAPPNPQHWRDLLAQPVDDEWQQIFGTSLFQHELRPAESIAEKFRALQALIAKSNKQGLTIPVFLPPRVAATRCDAIPATPREPARTGVPLTHVPAIELFRYIASPLGCDVVETEHGLILKPYQVPRTRKR